MPADERSRALRKAGRLGLSPVRISQTSHVSREPIGQHGVATFRHRPVASRSVLISRPRAPQGGVGTRVMLQHPERVLEQPDSVFPTVPAHVIAAVDHLRGTAAVPVDALCIMLGEGVSPSARVEALS